MANNGMDGKTPQEILKWAIDKYYPDIAISCSFGKDSITVLHMAIQMQPNIPVFYLNTGLQFKETIQYKEMLRKKWNLNLAEYVPDQSAELIRKQKLYDENPALCCQLMKVEPTKKALNGLKAWITGLRRTETDYRKSIGVVEEFEDSPVVKINPIANWTQEDVWGYIRKNNIPYNPLYDQGFKSIGCEPCTRAGKWGQFERAGRWMNTGKCGGECGIHTFLTRKK